MEKIILEILNETIKKRNNKYCLVAGSGRNLGCYRSRSGAVKREKQVNYFKHVKNKKLKKEMSGMASGGVAIGAVSDQREENG